MEMRGNKLRSLASLSDEMECGWSTWSQRESQKRSRRDFPPACCGREAAVHLTRTVAAGVPGDVMCLSLSSGRRSLVTPRQPNSKTGPNEKRPNSCKLCQFFPPHTQIAFHAFRKLQVPFILGLVLTSFSSYTLPILSLVLVTCDTCTDHSHYFTPSSSVTSTATARLSKHHTQHLHLHNSYSSQAPIMVSRVIDLGLRGLEVLLIASCAYYNH